VQQYESVSLYAKYDTGWSRLHSQVRQNIAVRIDEGFKRFFEALKEGRPNVSPPKWIHRKKYRSFTFPQYGTAAKITKGRVHLSGLGEFKIRDYRKVRGKKKTINVKWCQGHWWVVVVSMVQAKELFGQEANSAKPEIGVDPGLKSLLVTSQGDRFDPPRAFENIKRRLAHEQKKMARQFAARKLMYEQAVKEAKAKETPPPELKDFPYSNRLKKQIAIVGRLHTLAANVRDHHQKKIAANISDRFGLVAVEEHSVQFMIRNRRQAKAASDRALSAMKQRLQSKLGPRYIPTANRRPGCGGNSQTCVCGAAVPKKLSDRIHQCLSCGLVEDRDHVSANIVQLIAFGTIDLSLKARHPGGMSSQDVESTSGSGAKAAGQSQVLALECSVKRHSHASQGCSDWKEARRKHHGWGTCRGRQDLVSSQASACVVPCAENPQSVERCPGF
jgi:transposase